MDYNEYTLPEMLDNETLGAYDHGYVGKWHLSSSAVDHWTNPNTHGWNSFSGIMEGVTDSNTMDGAGQDYFDWEKTIDGATVRTTTYLTTDNADDALALMNTMPEPWLIVVSFQAPHAPFHTPPQHLRRRVRVGGAKEIVQFNWMIEAVDREIERVLDEMPDSELAHTTVMALGDNGTPGEVVTAPSVVGKKSLYEGGIHIPLIVAGASVTNPGRRSDDLVNTVDLFATIADIAGVSSPDTLTEDSISFLPILQDTAMPTPRATAYSETFSPNGLGPYDDYGQAVIGQQYKLIRKMGMPDMLFDLSLTGRDTDCDDLLADGVLTADEQVAYDELLAALPVTPF